MIALRPDRDGVHVGASGVEEMQRLHGAHLIDFHIPEAGTPTQGVEAGYMANGWVRARHEDYDSLRSILDWIGENVRLSAPITDQIERASHARSRRTSSRRAAPLRRSKRVPWRPR